MVENRDGLVPLARIQAREDVRNVLLWLDSIVKLGPAATQHVDVAATARWLGAMLGVPDELVSEPSAMDALAAALAGPEPARAAR